MGRIIGSSTWDSLVGFWFSFGDEESGEVEELVWLRRIWALITSADRSNVRFRNRPVRFLIGAAEVSCNRAWRCPLNTTLPRREVLVRWENFLAVPKWEFDGQLPSQIHGLAWVGRPDEASGRMDRNAVFIIAIPQRISVPSPPVSSRQGAPVSRRRAES